MSLLASASMLASALKRSSETGVVNDSIVFTGFGDPANIASPKLDGEYKLIRPDEEPTPSQPAEPSPRPALVPRQRAEPRKPPPSSVHLLTQGVEESVDRVVLRVSYNKTVEEDRRTESVCSVTSCQGN